MVMVMKDSGDNVDGDGDDNDDSFDNEDGECSLSTSCMMEHGVSLTISPRDHPVHVSHSYHSVHPLMDYVLLIKHAFV